MSFVNKVVIVTGSSSGIGAATAKLFAKEKAKVVIVGRNVEKLKNVSKQISKIGCEPLTVVADISKDDQAKSIIEKTMKKFGKIDILINNAGFYSMKTILDADYVEDFDRVLGTDLRGAVVVTHAAAPHLIKSKGNIVMVSSMLSALPSEHVSAYCVAKAGMDHFARCTALALAKEGVRVNCVNPGPVNTDININTLGFTKEQSDKMYEDSAKKTPLRLVSSSEEVGNLILFLASDKAKSVTGADYTIDCGVKLAGLSSMK